jgi:elongation factor Ts
MATIEQIKELRQKTGAGMMQCKEALAANSDDESNAIIWLRQRGISIADGKSSRPTDEGIIGSYIHTGGKVGVLIEVLCETDFVSRSDEFQELVRNLGMQITAYPAVSYVSVDNIPIDISEKETEIEMGKNDLASKPDAIKAKIVEGRVAKRLKEMCLMSQVFVKDNTLTVEEYVKSVSGKLQENIRVSKFVRFTLGS